MLNESQLKVIAEHPLADTLDDVRDKLRDGVNPQAVVTSLLGALVLSSAAFNLPASDGNVAGKLLAIQQSVRGGTLKTSTFKPLIETVVKNSADTEIWDAVLSLLQVVNPSTPPLSSIIPTHFATPVKTSSSRLDDSETRVIIEHGLFYEIKDCTHRGVPGFFKKHFNPATWDKKAQGMLKLIMKNHNGTKWKGFPAKPWEQPVWDWLVQLEETALDGAPYTLHRTKSAHEFKQGKGQIDVFFKNPERSELHHKHILVVGELKRTLDSGEFKATMLQLTRHVRSIFADQPMRRFIHAFTIKSMIMELWIFDRSGAYSSGEFNIHNEPEKLGRALVAYATMNNKAMGLDQSIEWKDKHRYITVEGIDGNAKRVELNRLIVRQRAVVCRGTTCFATRHGVAKFSWRSAKRQPSEVKHLKTAGEKGVEGVAKLVGHRDIVTIADLRAGLEFSKKTQYSFKATTHDRSDGYNRSASDVSGSSRKRKLVGEDARPSSRRRSNSQKSMLHEAHGNKERSKEASGNVKPSLYTPDQDDPYEDRILSCLVISPAGRVLSDFESVRELLETLQDAIKAHQSLYIKGQILHRDISSNNIIITDRKNSGGFRGMLIDLDLAKKLDAGRTGARHQTGTMQFMAIEVLRGTDHTYRHDLESFFYVLLWMCARCAWDKEEIRGREQAPVESDLRAWEIGGFKTIAKAKEGDMTVNGLKRIMGEFPEALEMVQPLCLKIRSILFGDTAEQVTGTPSGEPARLYSAIIDAYDEVIEHL